MKEKNSNHQYDSADGMRVGSASSRKGNSVV